MEKTEGVLLKKSYSKKISDSIPIFFIDQDISSMISFKFKLENLIDISFRKWNKNKKGQTLSEVIYSNKNKEITQEINLIVTGSFLQEYLNELKKELMDYFTKYIKENNFEDKVKDPPSNSHFSVLEFIAINSNLCNLCFKKLNINGTNQDAKFLNCDRHSYHDNCMKFWKLMTKGFVCPNCNKEDAILNYFDVPI